MSKPEYTKNEYKELYEHLMDRNLDLVMALVSIKYMLGQIPEHIPPLERQEIEKVLARVGL